MENNTQSDDGQASGSSVGQKRLVHLDYQGKKWTAELIPNSRCFVRFRNTECDRDGMCWSAPTEELDNLARAIYHGKYQPNQEDLYMMLSIIDSFKSLLFKPAKEQRILAKTLRQILEVNVIADSPAQPE